LRQLIKIFLIIATIFISIFFIMKFTGILSIEQIKELLQQAKNVSPFYVGALVIALLFIDLFIAIPTLTTIILAGYFLGFMLGALFSIIGILLAGTIGYILSRRYGDKILLFLIKDDTQRIDAIETFHKHGFVTILLSRAIPLLPEASACLSGITKMGFKKFLLAWLLSAIPYVLIISYAGSISTIDDPKPAIITAIGISVFFWISWFFYHKKHKSVA